MNGGAWVGSANATVPSDGGDALTETTRALWGNISMVSAALKKVLYSQYCASATTNPSKPSGRGRSNNE